MSVSYPGQSLKCVKVTTLGPRTLQESKLDDVDSIAINGYSIYTKNRKIVARYRSGGIALIVKNELIPFIHVLKTESKLILWFSISKSIMPNKEALLCGLLYIPPYGTKYAHADPYLELQNELYKLCSNMKHVIILGDFNSRSSTMCDYIRTDDFICEINGNQELFDENMDIFHCFENNNIPLERINIDKITNSYGYQLVEFCKNNNIFIMNGRLDAQLPSLTCKNSSTVDYMLATANTFENISAFHVLKFDSLYSDAHCPLSVNIKTRYANTSKTAHQPTIGTIPEVKLWDSNKSDLFIENINYDEISKINSFLDVLGTEQNVHIHNINETVRRIENLFISNSKASFGQKRIKPNSHRQNTTNKQWFNKECRDARNTYHNVRRLYNKYKTNHYKHLLKKSVMRTKKQYRKISNVIIMRK